MGWGVVMEKLQKLMSFWCAGSVSSFRVSFIVAKVIFCDYLNMQVIFMSIKFIVH